MDTFELLPTLAQGELSETSAPELVAAVFRSRASGTLFFETPKGTEVRVFFRAGDMCGTGVFEGFHTLAHVLLANDWVNALDIDSSRDEAAATKKRHGEVLVSRGLLTAEKLQAALKAQHATNLGRVLSMTEGKYDWRGWEPPPPWSREVQVDPIGPLVEALQQEQHRNRRSRIIAWLGIMAVRLSVDWNDLQGRIALDPVDRRAALLLGRPTKLSDFVRASKLPLGRAEALLAALLLAGAAEPCDAGAKAVVNAAPEPPAEEELPQAELLEDEAEDEPLELAPKPRKAVMDEAEALERLDSLELDDDGTPTNPQPTSPQRREEEPLELDEERAPPGKRRAEPASFASDEGAARELRKKMLARGLRNLGTIPPPDRGEEPEPEATNEPEPEREHRPAVFDTGPLSPEDRLFAEEVRVRVVRAPKQSAYVRLGVQPNATNEQIKTAYLQAAKRFHPDRATSAGLEPLQADLKLLFGLLKEAYEAIATPEARARYQQRPSGGGKGSASRSEDAHTALKMGEVLLKKRDFAAALDKLRRAVELDPSGDTLAALAWGLVRDPKCTAEGKEEAADLIRRALRADGVTARTYYVAGVLSRTTDPEGSAEAFRKALQLDPHHSDAALELRLIEQRRTKKEGTASSGGVLSGLFGKRKG